jgi:hypothetical protein
MKKLTPALLERLRDLALVDIDVLLAGRAGSDAVELGQAFVADVEQALGEARAVFRDQGAALVAAPDPLGLLDQSSRGRMRGGEPALSESNRRFLERARIRRDLACLEDLCRDVVPRLLAADRRLAGLAEPGATA